MVPGIGRVEKSQSYSVLGMRVGRQGSPINRDLRLTPAIE